MRPHADGAPARKTAPRRARSSFVLLGLLVGLAGGVVGPETARAHEPASVEEEFVKGVFSPAFVPPAAGSYDLPVLKRVPPFVLRDSTGRDISTRTVLAGKVAVVSFIYTACPERLGCPLASVALQDLQVRLRSEGLQQSTVLVSISFDPARDVPAQLAKYAQVYGADPALWRFMTAPSRRVLAALLESFGQDRAPVYDAQGRFTGRYSHVLKVFLVDQGGYIRNIYSAGFLVPDLVVNDIKTVLTERGGRPAGDWAR